VADDQRIERLDRHRLQQAERRARLTYQQRETIRAKQQRYWHALNAIGSNSN